jgi:hypothetical protein
MLSETLMPLPDEIAHDAEFSVEPTNAEGFEAEWSAAVGR